MISTILRQLETDKPKVYFHLRTQCYAFIWHFQVFPLGHLTSFSDLACSNLDSVPWTHLSPVYLMVCRPLSQKKNATKLTLKMKEGAFSRSQVGASSSNTLFEPYKIHSPPNLEDNKCVLFWAPPFVVYESCSSPAMFLQWYFKPVYLSPSPSLHFQAGFTITTSN